MSCFAGMAARSVLRTFHMPELEAPHLGAPISHRLVVLAANLNSIVGDGYVIDLRIGTELLKAGPHPFKRPLLRCILARLAVQSVRQRL